MSLVSFKFGERRILVIMFFSEMTDSNPPSLTAQGAVQLERNFHDSVDELLALCSEVTEQAEISLGKFLENPKKSKSHPYH